MIKLMEELAPWDIFSARILAAHRSYSDMGAGQFWVQEDHAAPAAALSLVDGFAVLSAGENADWEELAAFLKMQPWHRLQCDEAAAGKLDFPTEWRSMLVRWTAPKKEYPHGGIKEADDPGNVYDILKKSGLDVQNRNEWAADLALRWRRGTAKTWMIDEACTGSAMAITAGHVFIGALGTLPEHRGRGLAGQLITHICGQFGGREIWLSCREELQGFYESIGFERAGDMITMQKKGSV